MKRLVNVTIGPACKREEDNNDNTSTTSRVKDVKAWTPTVLDGRCTPCNDHMDKCMGKWPCWFYNCQPDCNKEVCEQLPDVSNLDGTMQNPVLIETQCRTGCGYHC